MNKTRLAVLSSSIALAVLTLTQQANSQAETKPGNAASAQAKPNEIVMAVHEQRSVPLAGSPSRVAIGDPGVADVQFLKGGSRQSRNVMLFAKKPGTTDLQVWVNPNQGPQRWKVRVIGGVQDVLASRGQPLTTQVDVSGDQAVLTGSAPSMLEHRKSAEAAQAATGKDHAVDLSTIDSGGVVQVEVKVVELSRSVMKDVGLRAAAGGSGPWSGGISLMPSSLLGEGFSLLYDSSNFNATLGLLEQNGMARILAEPTLVALSGQSASFLAGGEIPVPESGGLGTQTVSYKPFGIGLTVTPTVLSRDRIALKVAPEASELDYTNAIRIVNGDQVTLMPALRTRKADTTIELGDGESYIISGLVSRQTIANVSKIPLLGDLPIIGSFFRNVRYSQEDRELVIVVTPRLVQPIAKNVKLPLPGGRQEKGDTAGNAWGYYLLGPAGGEQMPGFSR